MRKKVPEEDDPEDSEHDPEVVHILVGARGGRHRTAVCRNLSTDAVEVLSAVRTERKGGRHDVTTVGTLRYSVS
jgi:hypothetical protein